ncbi:unnamed protein product [Ceutorhynchus assimilis]|uniref:Uncharacterized protein n=1 Tax=Ceutorhynchus assimilis TaxID=467358 RepID=A0A9N9MC48_9CUCU|nr:unnamed protein product [Ceutorhynchus assimilis]
MGEPTSFGEMFELLSQQNKKQTASLTDQIKGSEQNLRNQIRKSSQQLANVQERNIILERKIRRNNILLFGLKVENNNSLITDTLTKINELFSLNIQTNDINNIYKVGRRESAPILIEFLSYLKKSELFKNPEKLRNLKDTDYAIANDLCEEDRRDLKILKKHQREAREEGKEARIKGFKLEINNTLYTAKELETLSEIHTDSSGSEDTGEETDQETNRNGAVLSEKLSIDNKKRKKRKENTPSPEGIKTRAHKKKKKHY